MIKRGNAQMTTQRKRNLQMDAHCWKYYFKKYGFDYTLINRQRVYLSPINQEVQHIG